MMMVFLLNIFKKLFKFFYVDYIIFSSILFVYVNLKKKKYMLNFNVSFYLNYFIKERLIGISSFLFIFIFDVIKLLVY